MEANALSLLNLFTECDPEAKAIVKGDTMHPDLTGTVLFYPFGKGTLIFVSLSGLPDIPKPCESDFFAFHIHAGNQCSGTAENPFANAGMHYNPSNCPHPAHAGDLPLLLSNDGFTFQMCYTNRFIPRDVIGRTVIIHSKPDDYHTQPSGNPGAMIGCGEIKKYSK